LKPTPADTKVNDIWVDKKKSQDHEKKEQK